MSILGNIGIPETSDTNRLKIPRGIVTINDQRVKWVDIEITTGSLFFIAGTYKLLLPLNTQPQGIDLNFWVQNATFSVKIYIGYPNNPDSYTTEDLKLLMVGESNEVTIDPLNATVSLHGRDLTSRLIDTKITKTFSNRTCSQVAELFADEHGFKKRITQSNVIVGSFVQTDQTLLNQNTTQWDVLVNAAQSCGFVTFLDGETLVFEPMPANDVSSKPLVLNYQPPNDQSASPSFAGEELKFILNNIISGNVSVRVNVPYSYQNGGAFSVVAKSKNTNKRYHKIKGGGEISTRKYVYNIPGLNYDQAVQRAKTILDNLTMHGSKVYVTIPGGNDLPTDGLIQIKGTGTDLDQIYYPDEINRRINIEEYIVTISAKNVQPGTEIS